MGVSIGCVVEGHADRESVPIVIRRIAHEIDPTIDLEVPPPIRIPKSKLLKQGELERAVEMASRRIGGQGAVLVVLDSDEERLVFRLGGCAVVVGRLEGSGPFPTAKRADLLESRTHDPLRGLVEEGEGRPSGTQR